MAERKVLNKHYPPDFDPQDLRPTKKPKNNQIKVRMMLPMTIRCKTCGNYIGKGTKFNSRKEDVIGEKYLGISIFRFYFKCTLCSAELTMKTDPKNSDYILESGASRNFEPWREQDEKTRKSQAEDSMQYLETKATESKREMTIFNSLDELKSLKSRHARVDIDAMIQALKKQRSEKEKKKKEAREDEQLITSIFTKKVVIRVSDDDEEEDEGSIVKKSKRQKLSSFKSSSIQVSILKKPAQECSRGEEKVKAEKDRDAALRQGGLEAILENYGSD